MINSRVVAAIHVAGVRDDPCGAVRPTHCTKIETCRSTFKYFHVF